MSCTLLHAAVSLPLLFSVVPLKVYKRVYAAAKPEHLFFSQLGGHALLGLLLLISPSHLLAFTVEGAFKPLHSLLQSYAGAFHLSIAAFLYYHGAERQPRAFVFARLTAALFVLFTRLFAAWHLSEKSTRGLLISEQFVFSSLLLDGSWLIAEAVRFALDDESTAERTNELAVATTRAAEEEEEGPTGMARWERNKWNLSYHPHSSLTGRDSRYLENVFYIDGLLALAYALFHFAFPTNILKLIISPSIDLDSHHYMWCRVWGALWLIPALSSLAALHALPHTQLAHLLSRLVVQAGLLLLHIWGHWIDPVYSPNHVSAFMVAGFWLSFHISTFYRFQKAFQAEPRTRISARVEIKKAK